MGTTAYLDKKFQLWGWIVVLGLIFNLINLTSAAATEPAARISQPALKIQDEQNQKTIEKPISAADEKLWLKQLEIYGQIAKPQTVFIIPGTDPRVDGLKIDRHFFSHIFRPVEKSTLQRVQVKQGKDQDHILW